ncbi:MAG: cob(I)yrinic acid a,c-diamide adenosyltransferase [Bacteroidales bacterium]
MSQGKIYTKTGDKGHTSLLGGRRVPKYHLKIEAYGTIDELNAFVGLLRDQQIDPAYKMVLLEIQDRLFTAESLIARDQGGEEIPLPPLLENDILFLEQEIDRMNQALPELTQFILPGGHPAVSYAHVARCVCRRAERIIIHLSQEVPVEDIITRYFNRLSDYFFVLARKIARDLDVPDTPWKPRPLI